MKNLTKIITLLILSTQFAKSETRTDRLLKRYGAVDRTTFLGKEKSEMGAAAYAGAATVVALKKISSLVSESRKASAQLTPLLELSKMDTELKVLRDEYATLQKVVDDRRKVSPTNRIDSNGWDYDATEKRMTEIEQLDEQLVAKIHSARSSTEVSASYDALEAKLHGAENISVEQFEKEFRGVKKEAREAILARMKKPGSKLKKLVIGGIVTFAILDGTSRYLLAAKAERDPTIFPLAGVVAWSVNEGVDVGGELLEDGKRIISAVPAVAADEWHRVEKTMHKPGTKLQQD